MRHFSAAFSLVAFAALGCGSTDDGKDEPTTDESGKTDPETKTKPTGACDFESGYDGDDLCIPPPEPDEGLQLHVGPSSYDDPDAVAPFLVAAGTENVRCFNVRVPDGGFHYLKQQNRLRTGSHHMLIPLAAAKGLEEGPTDCDAFGSEGAIQGSQTPRRDFPQVMGPEDEGLARWLPKNVMASFQLHYVNTTDEPVLREAWVNLFRKDESEVTAELQSVFLVGDLSADIAPKTRHVTHLEFSPKLDSKVRIFQLNGHSHAHSESFTVWHTHGTKRDLVYQSFDWAEPIALTYNSVAKNPRPDANAEKDGGATGPLFLEPGDKLEWECDVNNTLEKPLQFANEALTAEMCLLAGSYVSETPGLLRAACSQKGCLAR